MPADRAPDDEQGRADEPARPAEPPPQPPGTAAAAERVLASVEPPEPPMRLGPLARVLIRVANVDPRDITSHSDRNRYAAVGFFLALYFAYATIAVSFFLRNVGVDDGLSTGIVVVAALVAFCIISYDRVIVGTTNADLRLPSADSVEGGDTLLRANLDPVGRMSRGLLLGRVLFAVLMAAFVTQALDNQIFHGQIQAQLARKHRAEADAAIGSPTGEIAATKRQIADIRRQQAAYGRRLRQLQRDADDSYRRAVLARRGNDPSGRAGCGPFCRGFVADSTRLRAEASAYVERNRGNVAAWSRQITRLQRHISDVRRGIRDDAAKDRGGISDSLALYEYLAANPATLFQFIALTAVLLLFDLAALVLKLGGQKTNYERRQAQSQRNRWLHDAALATRQQYADLHRIASEHESFAAARATMRAAHQRARRDETVVERADRLAVDAVLDLMPRAPPRRAPQDPASDGAADGQPQEPAPPPRPARRALPPPQEVPQHTPLVAVRRRRSVPLEPGREIQGTHRRWRLIEKLPDQGARSAAWRAVSVDEDRQQVVVKAMTVPRSSREAISRRRQAALRELRNLNELRELESSHIVPIVDWVHNRRDDVIWFATPYYHEGTLHRFYSAEERSSRPLRAVLHVACQIVDALTTAAGEHRESDDFKVVHRDLKPGNVLVSDVQTIDGGYPLPAIKVADWGLSAVTEFVESLFTNQAGGSPGFSSPEALRGARPDSRDDLYSVGAILWWLCTGEAPFHERLDGHFSGERLQRELRRAAADPRPSERLDYWPQIPQRLSDLVAQLLSYRREERVPADARDRPLAWAGRELMQLYEAAEADYWETEVDVVVGPEHCRRHGGRTPTFGESEAAAEAPPVAPVRVGSPEPIGLPPGHLPDSGPHGTRAEDLGGGWRGTADDEPPEPAPTGPEPTR